MPTDSPLTMDAAFFIGQRKKHFADWKLSVVPKDVEKNYSSNFSQNYNSAPHVKRAIDCFVLSNAALALFVLVTETDLWHSFSCAVMKENDCSCLCMYSASGCRL